MAWNTTPNECSFCPHLLGVIEYALTWFKFRINHIVRKWLNSTKRKTPKKFTMPACLRHVSGILKQSALHRRYFPSRAAAWGSITTPESPPLSKWVWHLGWNRDPNTTKHIEKNPKSVYAFNKTIHRWLYLAIKCLNFHLFGLGAACPAYFSELFFCPTESGRNGPGFYLPGNTQAILSSWWMLLGLWGGL